MASVRPTTGLPPGVHVGATGPRLLAALVEVGPVWLLSALALLFALVLDGRTVIAIVCVLLGVAWAVFVWAQRATRAAGLGMRLDSLQIVGFSDGRPIGWGRVLLRWLVFAGLTVTVIGLIAMAVAMSRHPRRQGWHDLAANAVVIKERPLAPARTAKPAVARVEAPSAAPVAVPAQRTTGDEGAAPAAASSVLATSPGSAVAAASSVTTGSPASAAEGPVTPETDGEVDSESDGESVHPDQSVGEEEVDSTAYEWLLRLDDGRDVGVQRLVLLGRNPQPRVGEEDATLIKVADETRTVSKSHLAVGVDARGLYVMDRGSTNGTTVTAPDGGARPCPPGDLIDVPAGSVVSFGDHWLEVRRPGAD